MTTKQKFLSGLLIFGLLFSSLFRLRFNLSDGFVFHDVWVKLVPLPLFEYDGQSVERLLTSTIIGYLFFIVAGILSFLDKKNKKLLKVEWGLFMLISVCATAFEWSSLMQDIHLKYTGQHLWMGPVLFLLGLFLYIRSYRVQRVKGETTEVPLVSPTES